MDEVGKFFKCSVLEAKGEETSYQPIAPEDVGLIGKKCRCGKLRVVLSEDMLQYRKPANNHVMLDIFEFQADGKLEIIGGIKVIHFL